MTDTAKYLTALADWFVLKGGEVRFDINGLDPDDDPEDEDFDCERPGDWLPMMHEVRLGELQVFISESLDRDDTAAEVGVLLRTGIPLPGAVVEQSLAGLRASAPEVVSVEVIDGVEEGPGVSVWLAIQLTRDSVESGDFVKLIEILLAFADSDEAREHRAG